MDSEVFTRGMEILGAGYPDYALKDETMGTYWKFLQNMSNEDFEAAIKQHVTEHKWFPKISEILTAASIFRNKGRRLAAEVYASLIEAVRNSADRPEMDGPTARGVQAIGGWGKFLTSTYQDLHFLRPTFESVYNVAQAESDREAQEMLDHSGQGQRQVEGPR